MPDKDFVKEYLNDFSTLVKPDDQVIEKIIEAKDILVKAKKNGTKIMIFGNGGSAAIASHFSVDLTKNANVISSIPRRDESKNNPGKRSTKAARKDVQLSLYR